MIQVLNINTHFILDQIVNLVPVIVALNFGLDQMARVIALVILVSPDNNIHQQDFAQPRAGVLLPGFTCVQDHSTA